MINNFKYFTENHKTTINYLSKNRILIENISKLNLNTIKDTDIIKLVCDYGLCPEYKPSYGEWNKFIIKNRNEGGIFQTPKQIADAVLELLKYDINTYAEIGIFKGGTHILIDNLLKLKNPDLKSIGIDIQDDRLTEDIKPYINLNIGTSSDFKGQAFDLVFIDADHSYEGISTDYYNLGRYAKMVMFHDINDDRCPGVVKFWNEIKEGKKYKEFKYQTNNENVHGIGILFNNIKDEKYPLIRHLSSYESAIHILETGVIMSRNELSNTNFDINEVKGSDSKNKWWKERKDLEFEKFGTQDILYCIPDWFNDSGYETGHGPVMIYFKPSIFEDFKITLTITDSLTESGNRVYNKKEIQKIYSNIKENNLPDYQIEAKQILENLNHKNDGRLFSTSRGKIFIEGNRFYNKYSEVQIHAKKVPIEYIQEIRLTDNFLDLKNSDNEANKEKLISICKKNNIKIV